MNHVPRHSLLVLFLFIIASPLFAQYSSDKIQTLRSEADAITLRAMQERTEAQALARRQGFAIRQVLPDGAVIELQRFEAGRPVYYITDNATAASSISSDKLYPGGSLGFALTGDGALLGIWDGGRVRTTHQEFGNRVTQMDATSNLSDHATHVAGTMIASGVKSQARGMAWEANLLAHDWKNDLGEMTARAAEGLQVSNHSYSTITGWRYNYRGDGRWAWFGDPDDNSPEDRDFGIYSSRAREWDNLVFSAPYYLPVKSAGNDRGEGPSNQPLQHWEYDNGWKLVSTVRDKDGGSTGYDCVSSYGNAKNILTVGAVEDIPGGYSTSTDVRMTSFSGWGPTDDGRIKPDIVANGTGLYSSLKSSNAAYASSSGTSMSSPSVAGSIGLLLQHQSNLHGQKRLRASTIKALLLHTADEAGPASGPDYMFGWGMMNTAAAATVMQKDADGSSSNIVLEEELRTNATIERSLYSPGRGPIRVTICWTDPAGETHPSQVDPTNPVLVHDLDLRVVDPQNGEHLPWILDPAQPASIAARGDNILDNVEQVFIAAPEEGQYTIRISHKGTLMGGKQIVSIIASVSNAPSLISPPGGLTEVAPTASLQWIPANGALSYDVQVSATPDFKSPVINSSGVVKAQLPLSGLQRLSTYYWRVRVQDQQGKSDWSDIWNFTTGGAPALAGHALYFDGADDQVTLAHESSFDDIEQKDEVTIEAWVKVLSWDDGFFPIVDKHNPSTDFGWMLQVHRSGGLEFVGSTSAKCNFVPKLGEWYHIAVSYKRSDGKIRFYVNGARECESNYSAEIRSSDGGPLYIGAGPSGGDEYAHGVIDELRIWSVARSETQISATMFSAPSASAQGLVTQLRMDEGRSLTAAADPAASAELEAGPVWLVSSVPMDRPPLPVMLYPGQDMANVPVQPELSWVPSTSALHYRVQISDQPNFSNLLLDERNVTVHRWDAPQLAAESEYYWRVNATNAIGTSEWPTPHRFITAMAPPAAPKLVSPRDGTQNLALEVTLLWDAADRAQRYHVQVSTDSLFEEAFLLDREDLISPTATVKDLGNFQKYFWRVRAINIGGIGPWSAVWSFVTLPSVPEAPILRLPDANAKTVALSPQFDWDDVESAATYGMQLARDSALTDFIIDVDRIPLSRYAASNLEEGRWYYWRANAANSAGTGPWSELRRFRTLRPAPAQVILTAPDDTAKDVSLRPMFTWEAAEHADMYRIEVATTASFANTVFSRRWLTELSAQPAQDFDESTEYFWRVRAENESGDGDWSAVWSFVTGQIQLEAPELIAPLDSASQYPEPVTFTWSRVEYADGYEVELSVMQGGPPGPTIPVPDSTLQRNLDDETTYVWRVRAMRGTQEGPWSATWTLTTTLRLPDAVTLLEPLADTQSLHSPVRFVWSTGTPQVTRYWLEWAEDSQFSTNVQRDSTLTDTTVTQAISLHSTADFWWRVRAGNAAGWGPWSTVRRNGISTTAVESISARPQELDLQQNYPNPVRIAVASAVTLRFTLPEALAVTVELHDIMGRRIATLAEKDLAAGLHSLAFNASPLPAGQYLLVLRTPAATRARVMTVVR